MYGPFYKGIRDLARKAFPGLASVDGVSWEHLISPLEISLPKSVRLTAEAAIKAFFRVSRTESFRRALGEPPAIARQKSNHHSVLMAYDFHTAEDGSCKLVEINTNGSGFLLASLMYMVKGGIPMEQFHPVADLFSSFENELKLWGGHGPKTAAIVDEAPHTQKMYPEFLMYKDAFEARGWTTSIRDVADMDQSQLIYNRWTDFYLEQPESESLLNRYLKSESCVTPNPYEYWLLADKSRLIQFSDEKFWNVIEHSPADREAIEKVLIPTFDKNALGSESDLWDQRKSLFFKPKRAFGGKSVYRGESVSRKVFERLILEDILVQKFFPAQRMPSEGPDSPVSNWKFDLRFFVYEDKIQLAVARSYQGQVTNFASEFGGFTFVQF